MQGRLGRGAGRANLDATESERKHPRSVQWEAMKGESLVGTTAIALMVCKLYAAYSRCSTTFGIPGLPWQN